MKLILDILAAALMADFLQNVIGWEWQIKKLFKINPEQSIKPIGCLYCTAAWIGLIFYFMPLMTGLILTMLAAAYITKFL